MCSPDPWAVSARKCSYVYPAKSSVFSLARVKRLIAAVPGVVLERNFCVGSSSSPTAFEVPLVSAVVASNGAWSVPPWHL